MFGNQGTTLATATFVEVADLVRRSWAKNQAMAQGQASKLYIKETIGKGQGNTKQFNEIDTQTFAKRKREAEAAKKASAGIGYNVTMTKKRIAIEIDITQEMRDENRYSEVGTLITNLTHFCPQRIELDQTHLFTFGTAISYVDMDGDTIDLRVGDGLALFSTAHTLKHAAGVTWSNRVAGDPIFSRGALEQAETLFATQILSNFNEKRVIKANTIVTGEDPNTVNTVREILESTSNVDQNNSGVMNVNKNKYRHVILPYLATTATGVYDSTKRQYWFLAAVGIGQNGWQAYYGEWEAPHLKNAPTEGSNNDDFSKDIMTFGARAGYGVRAVTGRGVVGSFPTSS